jgi:hypothetical protein
MAKATATAVQIREEIRRRIQADTSMGDKCAGCGAPLPVKLVERRGDGVNWTVESFPALQPGCTAFMMRILSSVMRDYDLA